MIRSMTGFASDFTSTERYDIAMEIKSVNSRYFEFKLKSYYPIDAWENDIKNVVFEKLRRGKVDLFLKIVEKNAENYNIVVNYELAKKYEDALLSLSKNIGVASDITLKDFVSLGNILQVERTGVDEELLEAVLSMLRKLLDKILEMMYIEGEKTREDIEKSLDIIASSVETIENNYPQTLDKYKAALRDRINELYPESAEDKLANNRFLMEIEMVASRTAINEELVRLKSHVNQFRNILFGTTSGDSKKLDFIGQEMNRETNTIASKSTDYDIIENTIAVKGEIEKIREQLRNLE